MTYKNYFTLLWIACIVSPFAVIPFTQVVALFVGNKPVELTAPFLAFMAVEGIITYGLLLFFGLKFAQKIGIRFLLFDKSANLKNDLFKPGLIIGTLCAVAVILVDRLLPLSSLSYNALAKSTPPFYGLLGAVFGVINQDVLLCLFCISGLALLLRKLFKHLGMSTIMVISIVLASLLFGIAHLGMFANEAFQGVTVPLIARVLILNAITGITFGLLFWRKSFETAVFAHFVVDFILYFLVPSLSILI